MPPAPLAVLQTNISPISSALILDCAGKPVDLGIPQVMGILNITPDSFSDGGRFINHDASLTRARQMVDEGASMIDIGGESTRPGARSVSVQEELDRVIPVIEALSTELPVPLSIDTSKATVMREAVGAGAGLINDVLALQAEGALAAAVDLSVPVCLMHMQGAPRTMQQSPEYLNVVEDVKDFLAERVKACLDAGVLRERILIDPGFGFGKTLEHNLALLKNLKRIGELKTPLLVGVSRKSMIGTLLGDVSVDKRLFGSIAAAVIAVLEGASIIRTHDIRATVDALKVTMAVTSS
ncbi:MAG: dihydropteroate synthase [Pseudomonadota bacterium]